MHEYAVFGHDRSVVGRWLGVIAASVVSGLSQLIPLFTELTGLDAFAKVTLTTGFFYFVLDYFFNKWIWKLKYIEVPDLSGIWKVQGRTLNENGDAIHAWTANLCIKQEWRKISINSITDTSTSNSYTASLYKNHKTDGVWVLTYSYRNMPNLEVSHKLNGHKGFCEIEFEEGLTTAKGTYFNSAGRRTYGLMDFVKGKVNGFSKKTDGS